MKSIQFVAAISLVAVCCAWRFAGDEVSQSQEFLVTFGDQKAAGRFGANGHGTSVELFDHGDTPTTRGSLSLDKAGRSSLTLNDAKGHARFHVTTDKDGATSLGITNGQGQTVWGVDVDAQGRVKVTSKVAVTPADRH